MVHAEPVVFECEIGAIHTSVFLAGGGDVVRT